MRMIVKSFVRRSGSGEEWVVGTVLYGIALKRAITDGQ